MTEEEKVQQARALYDAGLFRRKIVERTPLDVHDDTAKLACGHTVRVPRQGDYTEWECYDCRKQYEPTDASTKYKPRWYTRWYILFAPAILLILYYLWMTPTWTKAARDREAEWQDLKRRVTQLEELVKSQR